MDVRNLPILYLIANLDLGNLSVNTNITKISGSAVAETGNCGHNRHGPKRRGYCAPFTGELGPHLTQCGLGRGPLPYQVESSAIQMFVHNRHEPKTGGCAPFRGSYDPI